jgi:signal transduction histidine kinase
VVSQALAELRADFASELTDEHRLLGALADRSLLRLGRIADTMSLVAALDAGNVELRRRPLDLVEVLRAAVAAAVAIEPRREVAFSCELPEAPCPLSADGERLSRAVAEIVINAIRHARGRARLRLEVSSGEAHITVEDDGQGVADDRRVTLFRRFVARRARSGLGLGLSIAHDLIAAHGGRITLEASTLPPGRPGTVGARFSIDLPLVVGAP